MRPRRLSRRTIRGATRTTSRPAAAEAVGIGAPDSCEAAAGRAPEIRTSRNDGEVLPVFPEGGSHYPTAEPWNGPERLQ